MRSFFTRHMLALTLLLCFSTQVRSQGESNAYKAYSKWKQEALSKESPIGGSNHVALAFAASRYGAKGVTVEISVAVGSTTASLEAIDFVVQPVAASLVGGRSVLTEVGNPTTLKSPRIVTLVVPDTGVVASPQIIARIPSESNAVKIDVIGFGDSTKSVVLPLRDTVATAVLATSKSCNANNLLECKWFTGSCGPGGEDCGGRLLCAACNNGSPNLNCVSCTMGGVGGGECTPTTEAPEGCSFNRSR